jgi:hypothetical protein
MSTIARDTLMSALTEHFGEAFQVEEMEEGGLLVFNDDEALEMEIVTGTFGALAAFELSVVVPLATYDGADKEMLEAECIDALEELFEADFSEGYGLAEKGNWGPGWSEDLDPEEDEPDVTFFSLTVTRPVPDAATVIEVIDDISASELWIVSD